MLLRPCIITLIPASEQKKLFTGVLPMLRSLSIITEISQKSLTRKKGELGLWDQWTNFFIVMCRLRQGIHEDHLAHLFNVSTPTVSKIIITWINYLCCIANIVLKFRCDRIWFLAVTGPLPPWGSEKFYDKLMNTKNCECTVITPRVILSEVNTVQLQHCALELVDDVICDSQHIITVLIALLEQMYQRQHL